MRDELFEQADVLIDVERAMTKLTAKQREVIGPWLVGYTQEEIGEKLGITHQSVSGRIAAGVAQLRKLME